MQYYLQKKKKKKKKNRDAGVMINEWLIISGLMM